MPIRVNNPGEGIKEMEEFSMRWDVKRDSGTFTSITSYDDLNEILTGDAFDFRPENQSFNQIFGPFLTSASACRRTSVRAEYGLEPEPVPERAHDSQEFRYASERDGKFSWLGGIYFLGTDRFIGTGNMIDTGTA